MNEHLSDLLEQAGRDDAPLVPPAQARADAVRHRTRRRLSGTAAVAAVVAGIAVTGQSFVGPGPAPVVPATPSPTTTAAPSPTATSAPAPTTEPAPATTSPPPATSEPAGPPPLTAGQAREAVARLRFPAEATWVTSPESAVHEDDDPVWLALPCGGLPVGGDPLAIRWVSFDEVDFNEQRQVVVFEDGASAATAFADLRSRMRACHAEPTTQTVSGETWTTTMVGGQLGLGDESFWVAEDMRITAGADPERLGQEQIYTSADLLVLDDNVVVSIFSSAWKDEGRSRFVSEASAEWQQFRPDYEDLRRP